jgi:hypothetical protein
LTSVYVTVRIVFVNNDLEVNELSDNSYSENHNKIEKELEIEEKQKNIYKKIQKINFKKKVCKISHSLLKKKDALWF